jgi:hypothetical protein
MKPEELLKKYEHFPSNDFHVFGGDYIEAESQINMAYRGSTYDHRPFLPPSDPSLLVSEAMLTEEFRIGHACFKREVARVLQPTSILEIGIGVGVAARAFLDGCPSAFYIGIDNDYDFEKSFLVKPSEFVEGLLTRLGCNYEIMVDDSQEMMGFPKCDLVHLDGDHSRKAVLHDFTLAWRSGARWILCDDCRDSGVVAGIFDALNGCLDRGTVEWAYFPDTWSGSILIRTDHWREK